MAGCHIKPEQFFNLILGYNTGWTEVVSETSTGAGYTDALTDPVPADCVGVGTAIAGRHTDPVARDVDLGIFTGTDYIFIKRGAALAQWVPVNADTWWVVAPGCQVVARGVAVANTRVVQVMVIGFLAKLTQ